MAKIDSEILAAIMKAENKDVLKAYSDAIRERWKQLGANEALKARSELHVGQPVQFESRRSGLVKGEIVSFCHKNIKVQVGDVCWKVHPALVKPA